VTHTNLFVILDYKILLKFYLH